jgi:hypothetical protein
MRKLIGVAVLKRKIENAKCGFTLPVEWDPNSRTIYGLCPRLHGFESLTVVEKRRTLTSRLYWLWYRKWRIMACSYHSKGYEEIIEETKTIITNLGET